MEDQIANKIKRLELENFTCFSKAAFDFSPGINVLIGENGTGKTHLLKMLFLSTNKKLSDMIGEWSGSKSPEINKWNIENKIDRYDLSPSLSEVLIETYYPPSINAWKLKKIQSAGNSAYIRIKKSEYSIQLETITGVSLESYENFKATFDFGYQHDGIFIPSQEMLSWYKGFIPSWKNRESSIDPTYYFFAEALSLGRLKGQKLINVKALLSNVEKELGIQVQLEGDAFFIYFKEFGLQAPLVATGINKLAQLIQLIQNGSLTKDTILFWDEPEANLNPKYITLVAKFLQTLANAGCQIFVASHDYLLVHELSLLSEYREEKELNGETVPDIKFFALYKGEDGSTQVEEGQSMSEIQNDAIGEEYAAHHSREEALWRKPYEKTSL